MKVRNLEENIFLKEEDTNLLFILHEFFNRHQFLPGLEVRWLKYPTPWLVPRSHLTARLYGWLQPKNQRFDSEAAEPGGLAGVRWNDPILPSVEIYGEVEAKTQGWVAGNVYLDSNVSFRLGLVAFLF